MYEKMHALTGEVASNNNHVDRKSSLGILSGL